MEAKQVELDPGQAIQQAFNQIVTTEDLAPFEEGQFTVNNLSQLFNQNTTQVSTAADTDFLDQKQSEQDFERLVQSTLAKALATRDVEMIRAVFSTLGRVSQNVEQHFGKSPATFIEDIIQENFPIERLEQLPGKVFQPVDVGNLIETLFDTELNSLKRRNLSQDEVMAIRRDFQTDLEGLEQKISDDEGDFLFGQNTFRMLQDYINSTVENNQLRQLLLADVQQRIALDRQKLGIQLGEAPPTLTPLSATRTQVLRQPFAEDIGRIFGDELRTIEAAQARIERSSRDPVRLKAQQKDRVLEAVQIFNNFAQNNSIRNPRTGVTISIPTEKQEAVEVEEDPDAAQGPVVRNVAIPTEELIAMLNSLTQELNRGTLSFEYVPTLIRDPGTGQTRERVVQNIVEMERMFAKKRGMSRLPKKTLTSSISKRAKFKNAEVLTANRRLTRNLQGQVVPGAMMREIRIKSGITLAELAKIANMIAMESGSLEDIHQQPLLSVIKGITPIQQIVNAIMKAQQDSGGNDFSVIFVPLSPVGGLHLGGSLDVINKNRMLVSPVGGDIFSSLFNTVGNVVKTVASVPLQIAGSVFGGNLPSDNVGLEKPLFASVQGGPASDFVNGQFRPVARRKDAPQTGGAIKNVFGDPNNTFVRGEHQPEPFVSSGGDNNIFHIQPFPFGGRIDNTGFIDQTQNNPKFPWGEVPVNSLTYFP